MINGVRANQGLPALIVDPELVTNGRNWSVTMSNAGDIFHTNDQSVGLSTPWVLLGENVGVGPNVQSLFDAFIASPTHYANIVQPDFDYIGVGVYLTGNTMWTVHRPRPLPRPPLRPPHRCLLRQRRLDGCPVRPFQPTRFERSPKPSPMR